MKSFALLSLTALLSLAAAAPASQRFHKVHEKRSGQSEVWTRGYRLPPSSRFVLRIGLRQQNLELADTLLYEVSDPSSSQYAKHYTQQDIIDKFAPSDKTITAVQSWVSENGATSVLSKDRGWLHVNTTVADAERMLHAQYYEYHQAAGNHSTVACEEYSVPENIQRHIDFIQPGVILAAPKTPQLNTKLRKRGFSSVQQAGADRASNDTSACSDNVTPACIKALYNIPDNTFNHSSNSLGIYETGDYYAQEDLNLFFTKYTPNIPNGTHPTLVSIDGGLAPAEPKFADGESGLDLQVAYPLFHPQGVTLYQTDDKIYTISGAGGLFNNLLNAVDGSYCSYCAFGEKGNDDNFDDVYPDTTSPDGYQGEVQCGISTLTNVISISYSKSEADLPFYYQQRQCNEFMKLALQGHTILVASGDAGVASRPWDPFPNGCLGENNTLFNPNFPGNCPYVTTVGGTMMSPGASVSDPEVAAYLPHQDGTDDTYTSGGGFSIIYSIPSYQSAAIDDYFAKHDPGLKSFSSLHNATHNDSSPVGANGGIYNRIGRGMPDVSAISQNLATFVDLDYGLISGTSAATPLFASLITIINEHRLQAGKAPVGFINPTLYANPQIFNDITSGNNEGCNTKGFSAVPGWDPVTGLGTPKFPEMLELFMSLP
ncbi:protease s8 tripeptidyl peptidase [Colletotrichum chrysophilum]|uniref:Protease s8 tripeptidyl peptidase n=1 Tax=Colletotrichum chrysophilum TaxID=1836956 RepID=A0AAD9ATL7_9PEZI|nr:protease s8 tripeptidyl peptidase [Colletotrichum chrysophilum]